jgi:hypothetical protein
LLSKPGATRSFTVVFITSRKMKDHRNDHDHTPSTGEVHADTVTTRANDRY